MHRPPQDVEQFICPAHGGGVDLVVMMMLLAKRQVNSIWVEAGASLAGALLQAGLVDELILYIAPKLLGDNGRGLCHLPGWSDWPTRRNSSLATCVRSAPICVAPAGETLNLAPARRFYKSAAQAMKEYDRIRSLRGIEPIFKESP